MNRPFGIKILVLIQIIVFVGNCLRLGNAIYFWRTFIELDVNVLYIAISGGLWAIITLFTILGVWFRKPWAWIVSITSVIGYGVWYWLDRSIVQIDHTNWHFSLFTTILLVVIFIAILQNKYVRIYFNRS